MNMNTEEFIKNKINEHFNDIKEKSKAKGIYLGPMEELYFKMGAAYGITVAGLSLMNVETTNLI